MSIQSLTEKFHLQTSPDRIFEWIVDTDHLQEMLPRYLSSEITKRSSRTLGRGSTLEIHLRSMGWKIPMTLRVISLNHRRHLSLEMKCPFFFILEQDFYFESVRQGQTWLTIIFLYRPRWGYLGQLLTYMFLRRILLKTIRHQKKQIMDRFQGSGT